VIRPKRGANGLTSSATTWPRSETRPGSETRPESSATGPPTIETKPLSSGDQAGDERDEAAEQRDQAGDERDRAAGQRDLAGDERDKAAAQRDQVAAQRDRAGAERDQAGDDRDRAGDQRDRAGERRDQAADSRDRVAERVEASISAGIPPEALNRSALYRQEAAADRSRASQDRGAGANERTEAEQDRNTALADRGAGASERSEAELDRNTALADRGAAAKERQRSSLDGLTGTYLRGPGSVELEREIARTRRAEQPLVLAFVDVDGLKAINDSRGHGAGDRVLLDVANALRATLRSHDLIIRYGGDEFACVISGLNASDASKRLALVNAALAEAPEPASVTVGVTELQPRDSPEDLLARADAALYRERPQERESDRSTRP
jgi:diguanylate cyclase (GGDEF)-like protein